MFFRLFYVTRKWWQSCSTVRYVLTIIVRKQRLGLLLFFREDAELFYSF